MSDDNDGVRRIGVGMMVLFWVLLLGLAVIWFQGRLTARHNPNAGLVHDDGSGPITLTRNAGGHFVASGRINGEPVTFLLDTGASLVSIPADLADRLGLERGVRATFDTANGRAEGFMTTLDRVSLGGLEARDVRGSINPGIGGDTALLGMSFLGRFDIRIRGSRMVLSAPSRDAT
ncbi:MULTISPECIES: TIGR02281 family clan AA aspartic protease [Modicisalibacter]|uniref:retropepsin-like aspartic protease family protein n=1 Tax=Modicisalibacter TaxID=574347 RepID=UPI00100B8539|nr:MULTISPECIES: TIGR02281 family clan AA aspartic protease [Halomonadaceae]MBZ9557961.1 TIGR02281 family clan AA aspartic protease [Modicisalibacter sp. R2A 31.J]MBZ9573371.1 TIGR02281 family clan AA aspartic protease [Modicisalibacter sp. MOD 31.J]